MTLTPLTLSAWGRRLPPVLTAVAFLLLAGGITPLFSGIAGNARAADIPASFTDLAESVSPSVVNISTVRTVKNGGRVFRHFHPGPFGGDERFRDFFDRFFGGDQQREFKQRSLGSGFIIEKDGYIVTNNHVVEDADDIKVILKDEREFEAEVIGRDANTDIALIRVTSGRDLPVAELGDSDRLKVGQWVVAIGNPFGLEHTVTAGIVSAKGRVIGSGPYDDFIQTDASINPGNSGGPLINMQGQVVGINTAIVASGQGIGFTIPINLAKGIIAQLKSDGEVTRGWLGVGIQPLTSELREYYGISEGEGVLVTEVFDGDPAQVAGIAPQDIIVSVDGQRVASSRDLTRMIAAIAVGKQVKVRVLRDGKPMTFKVHIAKRDEDTLAAKRGRPEHTDELGIRVSELNDEMRRKFDLASGWGHRHGRSRGRQGRRRRGASGGHHQRDQPPCRQYRRAIPGGRRRGP